MYPQVTQFETRARLVRQEFGCGRSATHIRFGQQTRAVAGASALATRSGWRADDTTPPSSTAEPTASAPTATPTGIASAGTRVLHCRRQTACGSAIQRVSRNSGGRRGHGGEPVRPARDVGETDQGSEHERDQQRDRLADVLSDLIAHAGHPSLGTARRSQRRTPRMFPPTARRVNVTAIYRAATRTSRAWAAATSSSKSGTSSDA